MSRRSRSRSRSRTRSPPRRERDRDRRRRDDDRRDRKKDRKEKRRRHRSSSSESPVSATHQLGSLLTEKKRNRETDSPAELTKNSVFDIASLSEGAKQWLEEKVKDTIERVEKELAERTALARTEIEKMLRAQILTELSNETELCRKREEESRKRCSQLEGDLAKKIAECEESQRKYDEGRLEMLAQKSQLERERAELAKIKGELQKSEQQQIINKGGSSRAPIKFKFGK